MKLPWKGIVILAVLLIAVIYDLPTLQFFIPKDANLMKSTLIDKTEELNKIHSELTGLNLAIANTQDDTIDILMAEGSTFPENNPVLKKVLGENHFEIKIEKDKAVLTLREDKKKTVFISDITLKLNELFNNARKIQSISQNEELEAISFKMASGKRLASVSEPIATMLGNNLDWDYNEVEQSYLARVTKNENIVNLGLDLQGGMYLDVGVETDKVIEEILERLAGDFEDQLIDDNINYDIVERISDREVQLILEPDEYIDIEQDKYKRLLTGFDTAPMDDGMLFTMQDEEVDRIKENAIQQALETIRNRIDMLGVKEPSIQRQGADSIIIQLPGQKDPTRARNLIQTSAVLEFMLVAENGTVDNPGKGNIVLNEEIRDPLTKELIRTRPYILEKKVLLKGDRIRDARVSFSSQSSDAMVSMSFDDQGASKFGDITTKSVGRNLAIVLDGKVQSAPRINEPILGGDAQISGNFTAQEASDLAITLRSGALPAPLIIHEERTVGASLGADSIEKSLYALVIGFVLVIIFMAVYYKVSGLFSVFALVFNLLLIIATLAYFGATLTLPGMAGIILTIGMAVDANVLIFQRIREEIARGSGIRKAIEVGFQKATVTILDANITTILAAIVLFQFGTGPIKGFAVTLSIGIAASMFTSIVVTRFLFEMVYLRRKNLVKVSI